MDSTGDRAAGLWETGKCSLDGGSPFAQGRRGAWQPASEAAGAAADTAVWSLRGTSTQALPISADSVQQLCLAADRPPCKVQNTALPLLIPLINPSPYFLKLISLPLVSSLSSTPPLPLHRSCPAPAVALSVRLPAEAVPRSPC